MELGDISKINRARCERWHSGGGEWVASDWGNALAGETGELCNVIKKVRRHETHVDRIATGQSYNTPPIEELRTKIRDEIADVFLYLDLVANHFDLSLEECIFPKFNQVSKIQGFPERLGE
jgi:NTP pyrophosphatase (non-canonical NTP hydrolase)